MKLQSNAWLYRLGLLFALAFFLSAASFLRPIPYGTDSFSVLTCIRDGWNCDRQGMQPLALAIYQVLPFSLPLINFLMLGLLFFALVPLFLLVRREFDERTAWISVFLLAAASPILTFSFHNFGNELFAYPLCFWALFFLTEKSFWKKLIGAGCIVVAGSFWAMSAYFLVPLSILSPLVLGLLAYVVTTQWGLFHGQLFGLNRDVVEWRMGAGLIDLFALVLAVPFAAFWSKKWQWVAGFLVLLGIVFLQGRLAPLLLPFFGLGIAHLLKKLKL